MAVPLKKLENQITCSICLEKYTDPKQLQCNHVYCQQCLENLHKRDRQRQLTCPNCRKVTPIPASGVAGLQAAFRVNQLLDIVEEEKKVVEKPKQIVPSCSEHDGIEVQLQCKTCKKAICWKCIKNGEKHHSHKYKELKDAIKECEKKITSSLNSLQSHHSATKKALAKNDLCHTEICNQQATIEAGIHESISRFHEILEVKKTELIDQLHHFTEVKLKSLAAQREKLETTLKQISSCFQFKEECLKRGNLLEELNMKVTTANQMTKLITTFQSDLLVPSAEADIIFSTLADLSDEFWRYGQVLCQSTPDPSKCYITDEMDTTAVVGESSTATIQTLDYNGLPCEVSAGSISCEFELERTGIKASGSVKRIGHTHYKVGYQPTIKGRHQLHIKVINQHIRTSPFTVSVRSPEENLGTVLLTIDSLSFPKDVAMNQEGEVMVTERDQHCVTVFSPSGKRLRSLGTKGKCSGQFDRPCGVAVDSKGNFYVVDAGNHRIQKFTAGGVFITAVGTEGSGIRQFQYPVGIAVSASNGRVYVVDAENRCVQILNSDLGYVGKLKGQFDRPMHVACDSTGNVYITDYEKKCIDVFTATGKFLKTFQRSVKKFDPFGIAIDFADKVFVSEYQYNRVSVLTPDCQFLTSFDTPKILSHPQGIAVDSSGVVYVCHEQCVRVY